MPTAMRPSSKARIPMKTFPNCVIALSALLLGSPGIASQTRVIINLSDQRVSLVQQGRITLVSPIASGKPGWSTPRGNFSIFNKDIDHRSQSFGSDFDAYGRVVNSNATPSSHCQEAPLSTRADAILHGIQLGGWDACRLPSRISRVPRMRADAARSRCPVFRASPNWDASHGRRQHGQPDSRPKGYAAITHRFICVGPALIEVADQGGVCRRPRD
jgi:hypothetical protein